MVTDKQVRAYRHYLSSGQYNREQAAVKAAMTAKTARKWEVGPMPSQTERQLRNWKTRSDAFAGVWESTVMPELEADEDGLFEAKALFEYLQEKLPDVFSDEKLRTFQRRVRDYRATQGPPKEVFFPQVHVPGLKAQLDFTHIKSLGVHIGGVLLDKLLFECVLCFSGRRHVALVPSESYEALVHGVAGAFSAWNGVPKELWHDHMSAAVHLIKAEHRYEVNERYTDLLGQYGVEARFIEVKKPNQNGCVERAHGVLKTALKQALKLRRNSDFKSEEQFMEFVGTLVERLNRKRAERWEQERATLRSLPASPPPNYTELTSTVSCWSCIQVKANTYSVSSRLRGHALKVRVYLDTLGIYYKDKLMETVPRLVGKGQARIDYRHFIESLVRKPGSFANYRFREELFPSVVFRQAYDALRGHASKPDTEYLRILHLAARTMECDVEAALVLLLANERPFAAADVADLVGHKPDRLCQTMTSLPDPNLSGFDELLSEGMRDALVA